MLFLLLLFTLLVVSIGEKSRGWVGETFKNFWDTIALPLLYFWPTFICHFSRKHCETLYLIIIILADFKRDKIKFILLVATSAWGPVL